MRAVVMRVSEASVSWEGGRSSIAAGLLVLLGVARGDDQSAATWLAEKCALIRIFAGGAQKLERSLLDIGGEALVVSQFTLEGDCRKGRRPSFDRAAPPGAAEPLYDAFITALERTGVPVSSGAFGAMMRVALVNDGPVTLVIDSP